MSEVEIERDGAVASLILARPAVRNAMNEAMGRAVARAVEALNAEPAVRAVLVRGQGQAFCAGGDLSLIDQRVASDPGVNFQAAIAAAAPLAVAQCKQSLQGGWARALGEALDNEARAQKANFATEDVVEGVRAIRERRVPRFTGR